MTMFCLQISYEHFTAGISAEEQITLEKKLGTVGKYAAQG